LEESYEQIINVGFCIIPYEDLSDIIAPNPMVFGTNKDEKIFSFEGIEALFKSQFKQMGNMKPGLDRNRIATRISTDGNSAFIVEEITLSISSTEKVNTIFMRASCLMEYIDSRWKLTHWHTSTPVETENDPWHMEVWKREKEKLQKLVDQQTADLQIKNRELEIETALERVRARTMAMHSSDELAEASSLLFRQMESLGISTYGSGFTIWDEDRDKLISWVCNADGSLNPPFYLPMTEESWHREQYESWKKGEDFIVKDLAGEEWKAYFRYLRSFPLLDEAFKISEAAGHPMPERQVHHAANFSHGNLLFITLVPDPDAHAIFKRFAKVFEQTYTRFLDLQKAEEQAREAQIQLALERVRARAMAMHHTDELTDVLGVLFDQFDLLGINPVLTHLTLFDEANQTFSIRLTTTADHGVVAEQLIDIYAIEAWKQAYEQWKNCEPNTVNTIDYTPDDLPYLWDLLAEVLNALPEGHKIKPQDFPGGLFTTQGHFKFGYIGFNHSRKATEEEKEIVGRFAKEFGRTYQRFLDLEKAEAQTRNAQIEASLERVRAKAMSMQKPEELADVATLLRKEMGLLGVEELETSSIYIHHEKEGSTECWFAIQDEKNLISDYIIIHLEDTWVGREMHSFYQSDGLKTSIKMQGEHRKEWIAYCAEKSKHFSVEAFYGEKIPERTYHLYKFNHGYMGAASPGEISEESWELLKRATSVFSLAYTRFSDLKQAEAQAREAKIEAALERVRSRSMGMQKSSEMQKVADEIHDQLLAIGIEFDAFGMSGVIEGKSDYDVWLGGQNLEKPLRIPYNEASKVQREYNKLLAERSELFSKTFSGKEKEEYFEYMLAQVDFSQKLIDLMQSCKAFSTSITTCKNSSTQLVRYNDKAFTEEENEILKRFGKVFEQAYIRFLDLQKAEAQTREAQIEAALERVRSRSLAMHKTDELQEVVRVLAEELKNTGVILDTWGAVICTYFQDSKDVLHWTAAEDPANPSIAFLLPYFKDELYDEAWESKNRGDNYFAKVFSFEVKNAFFKYAFEHSDYRQLPNDYKQVILESESHGIAWAWAKNSAIMIPSIQGTLPSEEEKEILIRFAKVFEQAYIRFLDLQKAEAQAREAKIEAALEKIRSRTMGMQHSDELPEAANLLFLEIQALGIPSWSAGYNILAEDKKSATCWMSSEGTLQKPFQLRLWGEASFDEMGEFVNSKKTMLVQELGNKAIKDHYAYMRSFPDLKPIFDDIKEKGLSLPTYQINHLCKFTQGFVLFITYEKVPEAHDIFMRFTKVFEQTYTRFLDLQKAEAQAREAQIETALERVRARSMGMQHSEELLDVITVVSEQLQQLNFRFDHVSFANNEIDEDYKFWTSARGLSPVRFNVPYINIPIFTQLRKAQESGVKFYTDIVTKKENREWHKHLLKHGGSEVFSKEMNKYMMSRGMARSIAIHPNIILILGNFASVPYSDEDNKVIGRFGQVFEQSYTRFIDLKKAEAQTREAKIELSLERIRARVTSMQESSDLLDIVVTMRNEFVNLGHEAHYFWHMRWLPDTYKKAMTSGDGTRIGMIMTLPRHIHGDLKSIADWEKGTDPTYVLAMDVEAAVSYIDKMITLGDFEMVDPQAPSLGDIRHIGGLTFVMARTTHGEIGFSLPGVVPDPPKEAVDTLVRFAGVFDLAYKRFEDLKKAEKDLVEIKEARIKAETALVELKATQSQLVQREKLASLGELTAGIAHEIQNPLNFVNNFSEVSSELVDEIKETRTRIQESRPKTEEDELEDEILEDIKQNLEKIHHHGKRADAIVKGMLAHSRKSEGQKETTNLNALADEYLRLSYHGLRAKDKSFNADFSTDLDPNLPKIQVVPQDIGRVLLNLINNAFQAVSEVDHPKVIVETKHLDNVVQITVSDNGSGISESIKDKIFQPFFTTKPTGQGTGLGLSLSYDIVKAHGGNIEMESKEGIGTTFTILMPIT